jgi:4-hydroxybenzoate polyprenyltransferase
MANNPSQEKTAYTDIQASTWFDRVLPKATRPYTRLMRLDRPIGAYLLFIPGLWAVLLAAIMNPDTSTTRVAMVIGLLFVGSFVMRGAGCVINDMWDRDLDRQVERTRGRPLASGAVSMVQAGLFLAALLTVGMLILLQMKTLGIVLGLISIVPVILYPLAKRVTDYPQAVLGLTFNFGSLIGWAAISGQFQWPMLLLYAGCIAWTFGYDTVYAHQDKTDDAIVGVRSTALKFGDGSKRAISVSYIIAVFLWFFTLLSIGLSVFLSISLVGLLVVTGRMLLQLWRTDLNDPADSLRTFKGEQATGWIFAGFLAVAWLLGRALGS